MFYRGPLPYIEGQSSHIELPRKKISIAQIVATIPVHQAFPTDWKRVENPQTVNLMEIVLDEC